ncbi:Mannan endo-1,4-beta-mannosidase 6 [Platanthera zijinensis]|uniref:mannan endo-1,4-beta-mannosidase n=1 Tax=Platanthera zijinensis TaxID=2320716 RepID=A0AAP0B790_9ASPA
MIFSPPSLLQKLCFLLTILLASLTITTSKNHTLWSHEGEAVGSPMVVRKGNQFVLGGQPFYLNGFNTYWLMILAVDPSTRGKITETFEYASAVGLTVGRTWAFNDGGWRALQQSPGVYDENVFKGLDFVVSEARRYGIRLILSLINNWKDFGGKSQYVKWGNEAGLKLTSDDDFFTHPTLKAYYKANVNAILNRVNTITNITYKADPTIFAWELMNEARCPTDPSGNTLQAWIEEMASYVKSIDSNHLVEVGIEGFYGPSTPNRQQFNPNTFSAQVGTDFIRNHRALGIDFATVHIYPDTWISNVVSNTYLQFVGSWMQSHIDDADKMLGMPVVFTEFGVSVKDNNFSVNFRDLFINIVYRNVMNSAMRGGSAAGSLLWQLFPEGVDNMDDGYAVVLAKYPSTSNIISLQSKKIKTFTIPSLRG